MNALEKKILGDFKRRIDARFHGAKLVVFGSRARGDADPDSDLDVLTILDQVVSAKDMETVSELAWKACLGRGILLAPVTVARRDWEDGPAASSLLAIAVAQDGVPA